MFVFSVGCPPTLRGGVARWRNALMLFQKPAALPARRGPAPYSGAIFGPLDRAQGASPTDAAWGGSKLTLGEPAL